MTDLIDRNSLLNSLEKFAPEKHDALVEMLIKKEPTVDAIPVSFIESEIKRMELEIDIAMSEADDETAERWIVRKETLEFTLEKWRAERREE